MDSVLAACKVLGTPVISGNVSFYNENPRDAIDPTSMVRRVRLIKYTDNYVTQTRLGK